MVAAPAVDFDAYHLADGVKEFRAVHHEFLHLVALFATAVLPFICLCHSHYIIYGIGGVSGCCRRVGEYGQADGAKLRGFHANFIVQIGQVCVQIGHFAKGKIVLIGHHFRVSR